MGKNLTENGARRCTNYTNEALLKSCQASEQMRGQNHSKILEDYANGQTIWNGPFAAAERNGNLPN